MARPAVAVAPHAAAIIAIGSELLTAHRTDTNSRFLTGRLNELGIDVRWRTIVGDDRADLEAAVREAQSRAGVVITTGGLGPTDDDLTREAVASVLGLQMTEGPGIVAEIEARFARRGLRMSENNRRQAQVPEGAVVLANLRGSAPGLWIETGPGVIVLLPGPPRELEPMFEEHVAPRLAGRGAGRQLRRRVIKITGRPESYVDEVAAPIYRPWLERPLPIQTTILASPGQIELHLTASGVDIAPIERALANAVLELSAALGADVFSIDGRSLEDVVGGALQARGLTIAAGESCTGGLLLERLTDRAGSSAHVQGGVVAYADLVKVDALGVALSFLKRHGAVSEPVAIEMARGARARLGADIGVGITGIAGPGGGTAAKPVGMVAIAVVHDPEAPVARTFNFVGDRQMIRQQAAQAALDMVRRLLAAQQETEAS